ncbi:hypothetical protein FHS90_003873 [Rufibacter quisquiliarum]|uniref:Uncharacterized protein n=1 Tax=Rufibacter quisquiliarum TaxID=1549639 RepID=A0A839GXH3_9BACT|nr:hypothetical protein [Rufibacter quisquiliarum]
MTPIAYPRQSRTKSPLLRKCFFKSCLVILTGITYPFPTLCVNILQLQNVTDIAALVNFNFPILMSFPFSYFFRFSILTCA